MDQLSNFISEYLKTCETIKKIKFKNHQSIPYRFITISYPLNLNNVKTLNTTH